LAALFAAFALLNLLAVLVGQALFEFVPQELMLLTAAGLFLYFGYRSWGFWPKPPKICTSDQPVA